MGWGDVGDATRRDIKEVCVSATSTATTRSDACRGIPIGVDVLELYPRRNQSKTICCRVCVCVRFACEQRGSSILTVVQRSASVWVG